MKYPADQLSPREKYRLCMWELRMVRRHTPFGQLYARDALRLASWFGPDYTLMCLDHLESRKKPDRLHMKMKYNEVPF